MMKGNVMKINYKLISAVLAVGVAYDAYCFAENKKRFAQIEHLLQKSIELNKFYAKKIVDEEVPLDEFDMIVLQDIHHEL